VQTFSGPQRSSLPPVSTAPNAAIVSKRKGAELLQDAGGRLVAAEVVEVQEGESIGGAHSSATAEEEEEAEVEEVDVGFDCDCCCGYCYCCCWDAETCLEDAEG